MPQKRSRIIKYSFIWPLLVIAAAIGVYTLYTFVDKDLRQRAPGGPARQADLSTLSFQPMAGGPLLAKKASYQFAIFHLSVPIRDTASLAETMLTRKNAGIAIANQDPKSPNKQPVMIASERETSDYPLPSEDMLRFFSRGISKEQLSALNQSQKVTTLDISAPRGRIAHTLKITSILAAELAERTNGVIWDTATLECFSPAAWRELRIDSWIGNLPRVSQHIAIRLYPRGSKARMLSLGMSKFGVPDVLVSRCGIGSTGQMAALINGVVQSIFEYPTLATNGRLSLDISSIRHKHARADLERELLPGAARKAELQLAIGVHMENDPQNRLLELVFPGEGTLEKRQEELLDTLFGMEIDFATLDPDSELLEASQRAKARLLKDIKKKFVNGLDPGEVLMVKTPTRNEHGEVEWLFIEVSKWEGSLLTGKLTSAPGSTSEIETGQSMEIHENALFDYIFTNADGTKEGNETGRVMRNRGTPTS